MTRPGGARGTSANGGSAANGGMELSGPPAGSWLLWEAKLDKTLCGALDNSVNLRDGKVLKRLGVLGALAGLDLYSKA